MYVRTNMYVRTINGIVRIEKILDGVMWDTQGHLHFGDFIKASYSIFDLIEVGDYVNGHQVVAIFEEYVYTEDEHTYKIEDIKSIVTKECFESMSYEVSK